MSDLFNSDDTRQDPSTPAGQETAASGAGSAEDPTAGTSEVEAGVSNSGGSTRAAGKEASGEATGGGEVSPAPPEQHEAVGPEVVDEDELLTEQAKQESVSPYDRPGKWYVVHTQSGYEKKVKQNLEARATSLNLEDRIYEVAIPTEEVIEYSRTGQKQVVQKKMFPGYLLVRCRLDDKTYTAIRNTPGVTGFVGQGNKPTPLSRREVEAFLQPKEEAAATARKPRPRVEFEIGETVRVKEGPFADFTGEVTDISADQTKVKVLVNIFGRETPVELEFSQVAKL